MSSDAPLYERDPEAWNAHLVDGNATQPRKRVSADLLIRDGVGRILLVDPSYKPGWDMPGGMAEANEPPHLAAQREIAEELGVRLAVGDLLVVNWVPPGGPWDDLVAFVFDGGELPDERIADIRLVDGELTAFALCTPEQARERLPFKVWRRCAAALQATVSGRTAYLS